MTDWHALARARGLDIPDDAIERIGPALTSLETAFRSLAAKRTHSDEPAIVLSEASVEAK